MTYYYFNRCDEKALPQIEELLEELEFTEVDSPPPTRQWEPGKESKKSMEFVLAAYDPGREQAPFGFQTYISHKDPTLRSKLQRFIAICNPTEIYDADMTPYNMSEFK